MIIKIIERFDQKFGLYPEGQKNELVEKAEKFMEENSINDEKGTDEIPLNYDKELAKIVDLLTLYLRLVHSVDYYNHSEYRLAVYKAQIFECYKNPFLLILPYRQPLLETRTKCRTGVALFT